MICTHAHTEIIFYDMRLAMEQKVIILNKANNIMEFIFEKINKYSWEWNRGVKSPSLGFLFLFFTMRQIKGGGLSQTLFPSILNMLQAANKDLETNQECWQALCNGSWGQTQKTYSLYLWLFAWSGSILDFKVIIFHHLMLGMFSTLYSRDGIQYIFLECSFPHSLITRIYLQ